MGRLRKSSQSKVSGSRTVKAFRPPLRSHPMILRRVSAQPRSVSVHTAPSASHATPMSSDSAPAVFGTSLTSDPASTTFDTPYSPDSSGTSPPINQPNFVFAKQTHDYMIRSTQILQTQTETLVLLAQNLTSLNQNKESLELKIEQQMNIRAADLRCPLCSDLSWNPHICSLRHIENPDGTQTIIRCPTCDSLILRKPQFSHTIQHGVEVVANYFQKVAPSPHQLEWLY
ncbi:hypothetical protein F5879DRAFT_986916 [Lentinula edodes]|nr:hypothetical protein F5879DRAFT_986916 [Lentinula edodes]